LGEQIVWIALNVGDLPGRRTTCIRVVDGRRICNLRRGLSGASE